jgi:hypothetical protein
MDIEQAKELILRKLRKLNGVKPGSPFLLDDLFKEYHREEDVLDVLMDAVHALVKEKKITGEWKPDFFWIGRVWLKS